MVVFAPLESIFAERPINGAVLIGVVALGLLLIVCGILVQAND